MNDEIRLIPKKKSIKEDFFFGFSLSEFLLVAVAGIIVFMLGNFFNRFTAYKYTFATVIFLGFLLIEVPTTQLRFASILAKLIRYIFKRKELYLNTKKNKIYSLNRKDGCHEENNKKD